MRFEFATATRIVFGRGTIQQVPRAIRQMGSKTLVVTGRSPERAEAFVSALGKEGISATVVPVPGEPSTEVVSKGVAAAREGGCDVVVGLGGGSAMDAAKAIAALMTNRGGLLEYLEVIGEGRALSEPCAPCVTIPTTAGTGAEVTRNSVLASEAHRVKVSLRSPLMLPRLAVVDPELTVGMPRSITAATGLDALTQLIEPYVSCRANPMTDAFCLDGMKRVARSLRRVCEAASNLDAREDMALASLLGGLALANAGLGAVHGFAGPVGGMFPAPHGAVCAALLPHVMEMNLEALRTRAPESGAVLRYDTVARELTGSASAAAEDGVDWVRRLVEELAIPGLKRYGMALADLEVLSEKSAAASSMKANPIELTEEERMEILRRAL